ncbi:MULTISPECIES: DUF2255 family protein [Lactobacillaceae]|uniref:DUF2255 family protein n=1 Tax=Lactobacillaceae TaxID=33958 RepID=UPI00145674C5|nr:DUF2255 family protein [Lactobacillus sp. HBUAS51381]NLR10420.1 DUF2255 family protein [Lactobacillus sp. HBUAS51381]
MTAWTATQLKAFTTADDMRVSPFYEDGKTYGTPTWIWSVVVGQHLYVRAWNGQHSRWYQAAKSQGAGRIHLADQDFEVAYVPVTTDDALTVAINQAYENKYAGSPYLPPMLTAGPVSATVRLDLK